MTELSLQPSALFADLHPDTALVWLRTDLRVQDNLALAYALRNHSSALCVYIDTTPWDNPPAAAWWLRGALLDLSSQLKGCLLYRHGNERSVLEDLLRRGRFAAVYWNRRYEPELRQRDADIKQWLTRESIKATSFPGKLLFEPWEISKADGSPYKVFTPFYKAALALGLPPPCDTAAGVDLSRLAAVTADSQRAIERLPQPDWMSGFAAHWQPTRGAVEQRLASFATDAMQHYDEGRNLPAKNSGSGLSPWLHHGQIGGREIATSVRGKPGAEPFLRQLIWRDFATYILYHWPKTVDQPMDRRFTTMPWRDDPQALQAWRQGQTGIPLVDAGMRELWQTGFMHNRVRMVVASFLTKHLLVDWREGARWFEYTLLDADQPNNRMGWQWCAGSGVDAAPYFRIFNPVSQGQRFDADGDYVRRWVPELKALPRKWVHQPWEAPATLLRDAGVILGETYPSPLIGLKQGRERALAVWGEIKASG